MSKREEILLLNDMLVAGQKILRFTEGLNYDDFLNDEMIQDACVRNFEIMGEASKYISDSTKSDNPEIEWKKIYNYRNLLIHDYFGVNLEIVWDIISNELSDSVQFIEQIIEATDR